VARTYVALDLEMTGLSERDTIIEIAALKFRDGQTLAHWSTLVNPGRSVPLAVRQLTGIAPADLSRAPSLAEVAERLRAFVADHPIVGHTIGQDIGCLARHGIALPNELIDTHELATILLPNEAEYSLSALARRMGVAVRGDAHRAAGDVVLTKQLFLALVERAQALDLRVLEAINHLASAIDWPLAPFFRAVYRERARQAFSGASLRDHLLQRLGMSDLSAGALLATRRDDEPLRPRTEPRPIDPAAVRAALQPGGALARALERYEERPQQMAMAQAVAETFNEGGTLLVEAGTGTGKSLAYLLPAALYAVENDEHVIVSTSTINLQEQIFHQDLPDVQRVVGERLRTALLKGRTNYLCRRAYDLERQRTNLGRHEVQALIKVLVWLQTTTTGDQTELNLTPAERAYWPMLTATAETCLGSACMHFQRNTCFVYRARHEAEAAHVVVVNHALLLSDVTAESAVLPDHRYLIIDEAHDLEDEATEQFGFRLSEADVAELLNRLWQEPSSGVIPGLRAHLRNVGSAVRRDVDSQLRAAQEQVEQARGAWAELVQALREVLQRLGNAEGDYGRRLRLTAAVWRDAAWESVIVPTAERSCAALRDLRRQLLRLAELFQQLGPESVSDLEQVDLGLQALSADLERYAQHLGETLVSQPQPNPRIHWLSSRGDRAPDVTVHAAPLEVGPLLAEGLFGRKAAAVLTSATLTVDGRFDYTARRLGLVAPRTLALDSPFDYARAALFCVPADMPEPNRPGYQRAVEDVLSELCRVTEGRALVLFTSRSQLVSTYHAIRPRLEAAHIQVLAQGQSGLSRRQMLNAFRRGERVVLLGLNSFWQGVDVPGDALSVLVVVKLPFPVPSDPIFAARSELYEEPFREYAVPLTVLRFRQGFGRLIRSQDDRGVVVLLDTRILSKSYGPVFRRSLPPCRVETPPLRALATLARRWLDARAPGRAAGQPAG
jgi:DNA polymerase-3 subunit epsilon/ATP-dependent DNA helicase DinG